MVRSMRSFVRAVAAVGVAGLAASAWAQDYTVTVGTTAQYIEARPSGATLHSLSSGTAGPAATIVNLPFDFPYYGRLCTTACITAYGYIVPGATTSPVNPRQPSAAHGQDGTSGGFPYSSGGDVDGLIAVVWTGITKVNDGTTGTGYVYTWTTGTAPNRHFVVSWDTVDIGAGANHIVTLQCQLFEGTGRVVLAHSVGWPVVLQPVWLWGLDSGTDFRFTLPPGINPGQTNTGSSGADFVFDPRTVTYTGTLRYDRIVSDASGIGNSVLANQPLSHCNVRLWRASDSYPFASATTATDGSFTLTGIGIPAAPAGAVSVVAANAACNVTTTSGGLPTAWTFVASQSFASGAALGTYTLGAGGDPNGDIRAALNVARVCGTAYDWAIARTADAIPRLDTFVDPGSLGATAYTKAAAPATASLRIAHRQTSNSDVWDDAIITKTYSRHLLASIAGPSTTNYDGRFDAVTDVENAFGEGFGHYVWGAVSGATTAVDGTSGTAAAVYDLEHPAITVTKGPNVAGCVAGALCDLLDPANEPTDPIDGGATQDRVFRIVDSFTVTPTAGTFLQAWVDAGYDAPGITRVFVANGALVDDALEPNDSQTETTSVGPVGFVPKTLVLNRFNEDWFSVTLPAAASSLAADAKYDAASTGASVALEIHDAGGALLATGTLIPATGAVHATTGAVAAGTYKVRVRHVSGGTVPTYALQAYVPPTMDAAPVHDWTVGRDYDVTLGVRDGIAPYTLTTPSSAMPPGMGLNSSTLHATGKPSTVGSYSVTVQLKDGGDPANVVVHSQTVVIHDVLKLPIAPFVGFPAGKSIDVTLPTHEGTPPFTLTMSSGALTSGLAFAPNSLHVVGTATAGPSSALELDGVDVAGSADHVATRAVVAVEITGKKIPAGLAAGVDACGWWFDAVEGSTVTFAVATGKGMPKRALTGAFLAPDRSLVTTGKIVGKLGAVAASKLVCPTSGRYYFVASSTDAAGLATQLLGTATVKLPKAGKGLNKTFAPNATTTIEFGAVPGSTAIVKFAGDKKATLVAKVVSVTDPNGVAIPGVTLPTLIKTTPTGGILTLPLPVGGTWTVVLGATSQNGTPGKFTYSYAVKQLKGAVYSAE